MKVKFYILVSLLGLCGMISAQNLVSNVGFETWTNTSAMPDSWDKGSGTVGTNYLYVTDATQGNVLRLVEPTSASVGARRFHTTTNFSIAEAGVYRVTFKVKGNVGLRAVILVKGTTAPNTSTQSVTNHYTNITEYPSGTNVSNWTTLQYDITVPSNATFGTDYRLHFSWSSSLASKPVCDFQIDDISLTKYVAPVVSDDKLQSITVTPAGYTAGTGTPDLTIPGFNQNTLNYTFTSSYREIPVVTANAVDPTASVVIVQATSLTGSQPARTATITVTTTDSKVKTYTVEFIKHPGFISGISWNLRSSNYVEWESVSGIYTRDSQNRGNIYAFGNTSARCNSTSGTGYALTTPVLENGASTLSFYLKNTDIATDNSQVVVKKWTTANPTWTEIGRVQPNTAEYSNLWKEVTMNINDNSAGLKIRFEYEGKTEGVSGKVYLDDVTIERGGMSYSSVINATDLTGCVNCDVILASGGHLTINQSSAYNSVTVRPGAKLTLNNVLTTSGITLESDENSTATLMDNSPTANVTVKQRLNSARNWYFTPAVSGVVVPTGTTLIGYDETGGESGTDFWNYFTEGNSIIPGKGYIVQPGVATTVSYTSTTNSGNIPVTLTYNATKGKGFNLVGNPYPSYLSWSTLVADNAAANMPTGTMWYRTTNYNGKSAWAANTAYNVNDIVYNGTRFYKATTAGTSAASGGPTGSGTGITDNSVIWNYEGSIYVFATVNASGVATPSTVSNLIPPMQAFWVKSTGGTLIFKNDYRTHNTGGTNAFKAPKSNATNNQLVRLMVNNETSTDEIVIYADANAANTFDMYDAPKYFNTVGSNQPEIYTQAGTEKLAINAMNSFSIDTEIALGFNTEKANTFTLKATELINIDSNLRVVLRDKVNKTEFDLTDEEAYNFSSDAVNDASRFSLLFRAPDVATRTENHVNEPVSVFVNTQNQIVISVNEGNKYVIYNAVGQLIDNGILNYKPHTVNYKLTQGVYVVKVNNQSTRVIIK